MSPSIHGGLFATLLFSFISVACTTKVSTNTIKGPITERRTRIEPAGALGNSTWHWDGRGFTGNIEWQSCRIETAWKETEQSTSSTRPSPVAPYLMFAAGTALAITGLATYDYDGVEKRCDTFGNCYDDNADNTLSSAAVIGGGLTIGGAGALMGLRLKPEVKDGKTEQKSASENAPCIQPKDLSELKLVLQIADRKFLAIKVNRDWSARIEIPPGVELPRNVDLPVLVYSVPRRASNLVNRWNLVGHARAGADGAPTAD